MSMTVTTRRGETLAAAVRDARRVAGMSQRDLAAAIGAHKATIGNVERGATEPAPATVRRLEQALGVDLSPDRLYRDGTVTLAVTELQRKFRQVPDEYRAAFVAAMISHIVAWTPPASPHNGDCVSSLSRAQVERDIRGVPGVTSELAARVLALFDSTGP